MSELTGTGRIANLTELEIAATSSGINLADGHARQGLTTSQQKIIGQLPDLFEQAAEASSTVLDAQTQQAFLRLVGQHTAASDAEVLSCYSSSVAMEILSRALYATGVRRVATIHPTFDNIPDILRGVGMTLLPVSEEGLIDGSARLPPATDVLFITTPNNPTGSVLLREQLVHWARQCAANGVILVLDTSFRGFDSRAQYDHCAVLEQEGCRYVVIEDTGKLWPILDLKVGFLVFPHGDKLPICRIYTDILLQVSPLILLLVRRFAEDADGQGLSELHRFIAANRRLLRGQLAGTGFLPFPDPDSRISVERVTAPPGTTATRLWHDLGDHGIQVLPCRQFYWADPQAGERFVRVALSRPAEMIKIAATAFGRSEWLD